jgi:tRNA A-37 threonylcarbamoyl transferase component Bud32
MGMSNESSPKCPQCGVSLPDNAPAGLCPNCLMALNLKTETVFTDDTPAAQPPLPPEQIAPHFPQLEILECLGRGGMGVVYKARQKSLNRLVALKLLAPERVRDAKFAERFAREAQALAALNHPNIVTIHDFGQAGGFYYLLMEFVDGVNLRRLLRARKFTPEEALAIVPPLCDALQFAHDRGIVHRDIKPENLLLDKAGRVKVADFGIARMIEPETGRADLPVGPEIGAAQQHDPTGAVGTPSYSAPEQKNDPQRVDSRADIYSLGVVFYEMLTGELPGKKIAPPSTKVQIDVRLDEIVLRALEQKPELRYQQVSEVKTMVETIVATPPGSSRRQPRQSEATAGEEAQTEKAEIGKRKAEIVPRFSRTAIVAVCWVPFIVVGLAPMFIALHARAENPPSGVSLLFLIIGLPLALLGLTAPFGTTILGWIAVTQIRRSAGKLYGLWLAVFDGLLFPLLAVDGAIAWLWLVLAKLFARQILHMSNSLFLDLWDMTIWIALACASIAWVDHLIIRAVWRAVNKGGAGVAPAEPRVAPGSPSDRAVINESEWRNPQNWTGPKWLSVYFSKRDSRAWVQKQIPALGHTVNLGNPFGAFCLFAIVAAIIAVLTVALVLLMPGAGSTKSDSIGPVSGRVVNGPPFVARLNQGEVELVAVGNQPWTNPACWLPNGQPSAEPFPIDGGNMDNWAEGKVTKKIAFRIHNESAEGMSYPVCRANDESGISLGGSSLRPSWKRQPDAQFIQLIVCPTNARTMDISLGVANGAWEIAVTLHKNGSVAGGEWSATVNSVVGKSGDVAVSCSYTRSDDWESRMVYVDDTDKVVPIQENSSRVGKDQTGATLLVSSNEFARIKEFRLQRRKYQWVEFRNVSLQPGHITKVEVWNNLDKPIARIGPWTGSSDATPVFDAVIERVVTNAFKFENGGQCGISWLDGKGIGVSPGEEKEKFLNERGIDLFTDDGRILYGMDIKTVPANWDSPVTYEQLAAQLQSTNRFSLFAVAWGPQAAKPAYWFETRKGLKGILQITGFTENPRGVKIRYKLVQNGGGKN